MAHEDPGKTGGTVYSEVFQGQDEPNRSSSDPGRWRRRFLPNPLNITVLLSDGQFLLVLPHCDLDPVQADRTRCQHADWPPGVDPPPGRE
jgi:hypothetical protein